MKNSKWFLLALFVVSLFGCSGGTGPSEPSSQVTTQDEANQTVQPPVVAPPTIPEQSPSASGFLNFSASTQPIATKDVNAILGDTVSVQLDAGKEMKLKIPAGALSQNTLISVGVADNTAALPVGLNPVGSVIDFGPDGTVFSKPSVIEMPFSAEDLAIAGVESKSTLKFYSFNKTTKVWKEEKVMSIDTVNNILTGEVNHFSLYSIVGLSGMPPVDFGKPAPGDLLFKLSGESSLELVASISLAGWTPGHVGIYTSEKDWNGQGVATPEVIFFGKYNLVEAMPGVGVRYAYYKVPNSIQSYLISAYFHDNSVYMGARELKFNDVTMQQRQKIVEFVESKVGKPYLNLERGYGMIFGKYVKGPEYYNCVGLAEAAYEYAGVHGGEGILANDDSFILTPARQYAQTKPAGGADIRPVIKWARLSPSSGTTETLVLAEISVSHQHGHAYISSVTYETDAGKVNPGIRINDQGISGDKVAGDGIFSCLGKAGGNSSNMILGLNFTATDISGKAASARVVYTYTGVAPKNPSSVPLLTESWSE